MYKKLIILSSPVLLAACAAPQYTAEAISEQFQSTEITIIKDDATRDIFLDSIQEWCLDTAHKCTVVSTGTPPKSSELTLIYVSRWSWDFRTFIADARVNAYKNNDKVGQVEFKAPNSANTNKWGNDNKRIITMMDLLFGKQTVSEAQFKIKSGEM
ncbi:Sbal_3080 family lipoprotein [Vibrio diabolicus]|uniref:Sbal_3080 family lipoprotein n=1 Tax=Vibrio diabolicus TaxID=50719 RepID=UPI003754CA3A